MCLLNLADSLLKTLMLVKHGKKSGIRKEKQSCNKESTRRTLRMCDLPRFEVHALGEKLERAKPYRAQAGKIGNT